MTGGSDNYYLSGDHGWIDFCVQKFGHIYRVERMCAKTVIQQYLISSVISYVVTSVVEVKASNYSVSKHEITVILRVR